MRTAKGLGHTGRTNWEVAQAKANSRGPPHTSKEKPARHMSNSGVTWFHKEPDVGTRGWHSRGRALPQTQRSPAPVLGEASSPDEPKESLVTSTKNRHWCNKPLVMF